MIVLDTSAIVAVLKAESDADLISDCLISNDPIVIGAPTKFELLLVMARSQQELGVADARAFLNAYDIEVADWNGSLANGAIDAHLRFGKSRHKAALNFGDCMAYALAKELNAPLLFKGGDFSQTDVRSAL